MQTTYDRDANAIYVKFSDAMVAGTEELRPGLIVDFDKEGRIIGIEMLNARMQLPADALASLAAA